MQKKLYSLQVEKKILSNQLQIVYQFLKYNIATASMIEEATGIHHKNICRYKRKLQRKGLLYEILKAPCKRTGFKAWYLSTNKL